MNAKEMKALTEHNVNALINAQIYEYVPIIEKHIRVAAVECKSSISNPFGSVGPPPGNIKKQIKLYFEKQGFRWIETDNAHPDFSITIKWYFIHVLV